MNSEQGDLMKCARCGSTMLASFLILTGKDVATRHVITVGEKQSHQWILSREVLLMFEND